MPDKDLIKWARDYTANRYPRVPMPTSYVQVAALADAVERLTREKEGAFEAGFDKGVSEAHERLLNRVGEDGMIDQHALITHPVYNPKFYPGRDDA